MISAGWKWIEYVADRLWPASLELILAATLLLLVAGVMQLGLRRAGASLRHRVWALTMGGLLLVPLLCPILPKLPLPLSIPLAASRPATPERSSGPAIALPPQEERSLDGVAFRSAKEANGAAPLSQSEWQLSTGPRPQPSSELPTDVSATAAGSRPAAPPVAKSPNGSGPSLLAKIHHAFILVWAAGTGLYLLAMARCLWLERHLAKSARAPEDPSWHALVDELKIQFGVRWVVAVGFSQESEVPLMIGWRRPKIVLPMDCNTWTDDKRRVVLAHELSHIARHDVFWQVVARLACAVYWFHPLAWLAERRMRMERELACDDAVLRLGAQPRQYAAVLLDVAAAISYRPPAAATAIAMACRHPIQRRIRAILEPGLNRLPVGPRTGKLLLAAALLLVVLTAGLHPFSPPQVKAENPKSEADAAKSAEGTHLAPRDAAAKAKPKKPGVRSEEANPLTDEAPAKVAGKVIDEHAKPLAGADVWLPVWIYGIGTVETLHAKTDDQGQFVMEISAALRAKIRWWDWSTMVWWAYAPGHQVGTARAEPVLISPAAHPTCLSDSDRKPIRRSSYWIPKGSLARRRWSNLMESVHLQISLTCPTNYGPVLLPAPIPTKAE